VIHGCHDEQDIRRMGGWEEIHADHVRDLRHRHAGAAGFPLLFSGLSKGRDSSFGAQLAGVARAVLPGPDGALLTALFYMTRQVALCSWSGSRARLACPHWGPDVNRQIRFTVSWSAEGQAGRPSYVPHESLATMTRPLIILAVCNCA
jgi:NADH-quinone oxidoreductase subunit L